MSCLGVHFALDADDVAALKAVAEEERVDHVQEEIEERLWAFDPCCSPRTGSPAGPNPGCVEGRPHRARLRGLLHLS
jgi:hypothetical protein